MCVMLLGNPPKLPCYYYYTTTLQHHPPFTVSHFEAKNGVKTVYSTNPFKKSDQIIVLLERFFKINKNSYLNNSSQSEYELII